MKQCNKDDKNCGKCKPCMVTYVAVAALVVYAIVQLF